MEPTSWKTTREIINYLYEQGMLSEAFNEETESSVKEDIDKIIKANYES